MLPMIDFESQLLTLLPLNVLIIPDKFKGTLTAMGAAKAIARGWKRARPEDRLELLPMSDGGDGFGELIGKMMGAMPRRERTVDAAHRPCRSSLWYHARSKTIIIDSSRVIGLAMLPPGRFHPFELDTFGLGIFLRAAAVGGAKSCLVGIGGSATNDGGFGMARALGWMFTDRAGNPIEKWTELYSLHRVCPPADKLEFEEIIVAVDVDNLLLGRRGATRVYGPQKGLRPVDFGRAERCLGRLARILERELGRDLSRTPGAGAAGGLGVGFLAFLGARLVSGFDLFSAHAALEAHLRSADLVITGEGALDKSTLMGKGVGKLAKRCSQLGVCCVGLGGTVSGEVALSKRFSSTYALVDFTTRKAAKAKAAFWLERVAAAAARVQSGKAIRPELVC